MSGSNVVLHGKNYSANTIIPIAVDNNGSLKINSEPVSLSSLTDVVFTGLTNTDLMQYDGSTNKWSNQQILIGNIGFANLSVNSFNCNNLAVSHNLLLETSGNLVLRDSNTVINSGSSSNLDIRSLTGNINITANADIILTSNSLSTIKFIGPGHVPIASFNRDISGNSYIAFGTVSGEDGYGFKATPVGEIFIKAQSDMEWSQISNTNIAIGNTTIKLGNSYAGLDLSNSTGYKSNNLVGTITASQIDNSSITMNKLANNTITLAGRTVELGGSNTINLSNLSDVVITNVATDNVIRYNGTNWVNSNSVILSNIFVRNSVDTVGVSICPDKTATPQYGMYIGYAGGDNIVGFPTNLVASANSATRWSAVFHNTNNTISNLEVVAFTRLLSNGVIQKTGTITNTTTATSYNTSSDYWLKTNVRPLDDGLIIVNRMRPVSFNWILTGEPSDGFIAHELAEVVPSAVSGTKDEIRPDGEPEYQGIDTSFLTVYLVRAIQQLDSRLSNLQAELNSLKTS